MRRFLDIIEDMRLRGLPLIRGPFTWCGGLNNQSVSRLDHFLVLEGWQDHFNGLLKRVLPRPALDHTPILLDGGGVRKDKTPFRFENMWLRVEGFIDLVKKWWMVTRLEVLSTTFWLIS